MACLLYSFKTGAVCHIELNVGVWLFPKGIKSKIELSVGVWLFPEGNQLILRW